MISPYSDHYQNAHLKKPRPSVTEYKAKGHDRFLYGYLVDGKFVEKREQRDMVTHMYDIVKKDVVKI